MKKIYVIDTNVLVQSPDAIENFEDNEVFIPDELMKEFKKKGEAGRS